MPEECQKNYGYPCTVLFSDSYFSCTGFIQLEIDKNLLCLLLPIKPELKVAFVEYFDCHQVLSLFDL